MKEQRLTTVLNEPVPITSPTYMRFGGTNQVKNGIPVKRLRATEQGLDRFDSVHF